MTKKHYFMMLWGLGSVVPVGKAIRLLMENKTVESGMPPVGMLGLAALLGGICFYGFFLSFGMDFAKKIGIRFLFLDEYVDWRKDFFKPAIVIGGLYASFVLLINFFISVLFPFSVYSLLSWYPIFYKAIVSVFKAISEDSFAMLFVFSGVALLMKKIAKNVSMSIIMPMAIVITIIVPQCVEYVWQSGISVPSTVNTAKCKMVMDMILVYTLCWRKSFETALFCHVVIIAILYLIAPAVMLAVRV